MTRIKQNLDLKGLVCPLPILKTKQALMKLGPDDVLQVFVTDAHAEIDFKAYLSKTQHELIDYRKEDEVHVFLIRKSAN